jgi:hypothetical protein
MDRRDQIRARRRIAVRAGFALLVVASAAACVYDKSDYQGGGRLDKGGEAKTAEPTATTSTPPAPTPTTTATQDANPPNPLLDADADAG